MPADTKTRAADLEPSCSHLRLTAQFELDPGLVPMAAGAERKVLVGHRHALSSLTFSPDGKTLTSSSHDGTVRLWHIATGQELLVLEDFHRTVFSVSFPGDGRFLAVAGDRHANGGTVALYDARPPAE